jgi:hypothetical protein
MSFGKNSLDEIDLRLRSGPQFLFFPHKIDKRESLWFIEGTDTLFTGRIEIFSDSNKRNKIAECTIINGTKNGYFKQYYNQEKMLPGIMGLYVDDKKEGNWLWIEAGELRKNKKWYVAPFISSLIGSSIDTLLFFSIAFYGTCVPWVTLSLGDFFIKLFIALTMLIPFRLLLSR